MVFEIDSKDLFKEVDFKPSFDSDGSGDYIDSVDSLDADKFNHRWNAQDNILQRIQDYSESMKGILETSNLYGFFYLKSGDNRFTHLDKPPFSWINYTGLEMLISGDNGVILNNNIGKLTFPTATFIDLILKGYEQFSIVTGNTLLFEIQFDKTGDILNSNQRWYRLGHTGGEGVPALVTVRHTISGGSQWSNADIIFKDYDNNPSGKTQVIRLNSTGRNGEYIELILDQDETNYRYTVALWTGSSLETLSNQDTGIARSVGIHHLAIYCFKDKTQMYIDATQAFSKTTRTMQYIDYLEFESKNDSGVADYFDIIRFNTYQNKYFTLTANSRNYIYIDPSDGVIKSTTNVTTAASCTILYEFEIPNGASSILVGYLTDYRSTSKYLENININIRNITASGTLAVAGNISSSAGSITLSSGSVNLTNGNLAITTGNITTASGLISCTGNISTTGGNISTSSGSMSCTTNITSSTGNLIATAGNVTSVGKVTASKMILIGSLTEFTNWVSAQADGDHIKVGGSFTVSSAITISANNCVLEFSESILFSGGVTLTGDYINWKGGKFTRNSNANFTINTGSDYCIIDSVFFVLNVGSTTSNIFNCNGDFATIINCKFITTCNSTYSSTYCLVYLSSFECQFSNNFLSINSSGTNYYIPLLKISQQCTVTNNVFDIVGNSVTNSGYGVIIDSECVQLSNNSFNTGVNANYSIYILGGINDVIDNNIFEDSIGITTYAHTTATGSSGIIISNNIFDGGGITSTNFNVCNISNNKSNNGSITLNINSGYCFMNSIIGNDFINGNITNHGLYSTIHGNVIGNPFGASGGTLTSDGNYCTVTGNICDAKSITGTGTVDANNVVY